MLKRIALVLLVMVLCVSFIPIPAEASTSSTTVKTAKDLEKYLRGHYGKLKTKYKTFDLRNSIKVIENDDDRSCFDLAIVIKWDIIEHGYYKVMHSTKYTKEQKADFEIAVEAYQKKIANVAIKAFPTKKIRGGFLDYGYEYPSIKEDYYEGAVFGWKNYDYTSSTIIPHYEDTEISEFEWFTFNGIDDPRDVIGLY